MDDVRFSKGALKPEQILFTSEGVDISTVGYWQFEPEPGLFKDSAPGGHHMDPKQAEQATGDTALSALTDLCHAILNSNEFLYVH